MKSLAKFLPALLIVLASCGNTQQGIQQEVQTYLDDYNKKNRELYTASSEGQWKVNTHIVAGDTANAYESRIADEAMANFTGSKENIEKARKYLALS